MRPQRAILLLLAVLSLATACRRAPDATRVKQTIARLTTSEPSLPALPGGNAVYHWKTTFDPDTTEWAFLRRHDIRRLYLRFFDVAMDNAYLSLRLTPVPIATTVFHQLIPYTLEVVPVVYITVDAMRGMADHEKEYAGKILTRVNAMAARHHLSSIREVQLDCDWTSSTRDAFFSLCQHLRDTLHAQGRLLSVTVRLHQLMGPPPVADRGVLMLYNTGSLHDSQAGNSILSYADAYPYLGGESWEWQSFPIDFAYPAFSWGVCFRNDKFHVLLRTTDYSDRTLYRPAGDNRYLVLRDHLLEGHQLLCGDLIRFENPPFPEIMKVKRLAERKLANAPRYTILYHLDSTNLSKYTDDEINDLYYSL